MKLFAIKDFGTGKYWDYKSLYVEDLNKHTEFFSTREEAMRKIEGLRIDGYDDYPACGLDNECAWGYLERKYKKSRWHIDIGTEELELTKAMFRLSPVELEIKCNEYD